MIISVFNLKGGCGKTSTINAMAGVMSQLYDKKVLMIDLDPQCNLTNMFLATDEELKDSYFRFDDWHDFSDLNRLYSDPSRKTLLELFKKKGERTCSISDLIRHTNFKNLDIVPSSLELTTVDERAAGSGLMYAQAVIRKELAKMEDKSYDYILIDSGPNQSTLSYNAIGAADYLMVPLKPEAHSWMGLRIVQSTLDEVHEELNPNLKFGCAFITQYSEKQQMSRGTRALLSDFSKFWDIPIRTDAELPKTTLSNPIPYTKKRHNYSNGFADYIKLTERVMKEFK